MYQMMQTFSKSKNIESGQQFIIDDFETFEKAFSCMKALYGEPVSSNEDDSIYEDADSEFSISITQHVGLKEGDQVVLNRNCVYIDLPLIFPTSIRELYAADSKLSGLNYGGGWPKGTWAIVKQCPMDGETITHDGCWLIITILSVDYCILSDNVSLLSLTLKHKEFES